jgi:hypothetical protein
MGRSWLRSSKGRTWKRTVDVLDMDGKPWEYYEVCLRVPGVNGEGETWRGTMVGTLRECRQWAEDQPTAYKIQYVAAVEENDGPLGHDHLAELFRSQGYKQALRDMDEQEAKDRADQAEPSADQ